MNNTLTPAFERAAAARDAIATIVDGVRSGRFDLAAAFAYGDANPLAGRCFAVKVFEVVPGIGKVRARRTMEAIGLAEDIWLDQVPDDKRNEIITAFAEPPADYV